MQKTIELIPLFQKFIKDAKMGKRRKADGSKIKMATIDNYTYTCQLLQEFEVLKKFPLRIRPVNKLDKRQLIVERNYWRRFYKKFTAFLYQDKSCFDNYVGHVIKNIKTFFSYLNKEKIVNAGDFYRTFYATSEEIPVITLAPDQLKFLVNNSEFDKGLTQVLRDTKDIFVVGSTVALRFSDLTRIRPIDIEEANQAYYLIAKSIKTGIHTKVRLPAYVVNIITRMIETRRLKPTDWIFPPVCLSEFNKRLRELGALAGWVTEVGKKRKQSGHFREQLKSKKDSYRFCDLLSSHVMRRSAITTMLILGVPENVVRKISGHTANSKAFFRYVNYTQAYLDTEVDKVHRFFSMPLSESIQ